MRNVLVFFCRQGFVAQRTSYARKRQSLVRKRRSWRVLISRPGRVRLWYRDYSQ